MAQTNAITNGGFENGLTGWSFGSSTANIGTATTQCSFNATTAAGTETLTGTTALPPGAGTQLAMGGFRAIVPSGTANVSCVLYQDVAIPVGATTATLNVRYGLKKLGVPNSNAALSFRVHSSTATIPSYNASGLLNPTPAPIIQIDPDSTTLALGTSGAVNISSAAGTTVRVALHIAMTAATTSRQIAAGFDQVELLVTVPLTISQAFGGPSIPTGGSTTLTYTINNATSSGATAIGFTNTLPAGLVVATPNGLSGTCNGTATAAQGTGTVSLSGATLASGTSCTVTVNVTGTTPGVKNNSVTVSSSAGGNTASASLTVVAAPTVTSVSPSSGPVAGGNSVTITGTGFTGATGVTFAGTAATSFTVVNATTITAVVPSGTAGTASVAVTTPSGGTSAANSLYTYAAAPTVSSLAPSSGPLAGGTVVTITGTNFTGASAVMFGSAAATTFNVVSDTSIQATTPAGSAGAVNVTVTTPGGTSAPGPQFTYGDVPTISSLSPATGPQAGGTIVTITGTNFTGATAVAFGSTAATSFSVINATTITAASPASSAAGPVNVAVTTPAGTSASSGGSQFTYADAPTITGLNPITGGIEGGTAVTITGAAFTGATSVLFGTTPATSFTVVSANTINAVAPAQAAGTVNVSVTTPTGTTAATPASQYRYTGPPAVSGVTPNTGPLVGGTLVTITGSNFTGATAVLFGTVPSPSFSVVNDTTISATVPAGTSGTPTLSTAPIAAKVNAAAVEEQKAVITTVRITVVGPGGTSPTNTAPSFSYTDAPTITRLSPASGVPAGGTIVTITGSGFTGATSVRFGATAAVFTFVSDTTITATTPAGTAGPVDVTVTTPAGTSSVTQASRFVYGVPAPVQVPTLGEWAMIALGLMLAAFGYLAMRRRAEQVAG